jgi:type IV pilus assembly protein PilC
MDFKYVAYTADKKLVNGHLSAPDEEKAVTQLNYLNYQVISIKSSGSLANLNKSLNFSFGSQVKPKEIIMFSRQMAILIESGIDIVTAIDLFKTQVKNKVFAGILEDVVASLRGGSSLSDALAKFPKEFTTMYCRTIAAGEQSGNLDMVLKRMAEYLEKSALAEKKVKSALTYPIIVLVASVVVVAILVLFVLPTFTSLYSQLGAKLPLMTKLLLDVASWGTKYGLIVLGLMIAAIVGTFVYTKTPAGRINWDTLMLRLPVVGPIVQLNELARCCRTISMLIKVGLPLPDIMTMCIQSAGNRIVSKALSDVKQEMMGGEGLGQPMGKRHIFLPLMVQMVNVGEKTGNLGSTLSTVADSFEMDADDKTSAAIGLIQPALTVGIAVVVGFIAVAMLSTMYGIYGQFNAQ